MFLEYKNTNKQVTTNIHAHIYTYIHTYIHTYISIIHYTCMSLARNNNILDPRILLTSGPFIFFKNIELQSNFEDVTIDRNQLTKINPQ